MPENKKIFATPKIRKFARELGANISKIEGSARAGRITEEDVKKEFFDFEEKFTFNASELGTGNHKISAEAFASWETHPYIKKGDAKNQSDEIEISIN